MLSILSYVSGFSVCSPWRIFCSSPLPIFLVGLLVLLVWSHVNSLYILEIKPLSEVSLASIFFHFDDDFFFFFKRFYLFIFRGEEKEKERVRNSNEWLTLTCPAPGTCFTTQACGLARDPTSNLLLHRPALNPLSHTSQG